MAGFEYTEYFTKDAISPTNPVPIVRAQNVKMGRFIENNNEAITVELSEQLLRSALYKDCLLMTFIGAGVGDTCIFHSNKRNHLAPNVAKIEPFNEHINMEYALFFFMSSLGQLGVTNISKSTAQASLSMATIRELVIPIPPIKEQSRITNEVTKWFSLIDCIEENRNNLQETIKKAKSKILDLAIHGKLVPQDPTDEPACELLKRINPKAEITCDNPQYGKLPKGWCSCLFSDLFQITMGQSPDGCSINNKQGVEFHQGKISFGDKYLKESDVFTSSPTKMAESQSLLLCVRAPVGVINITQREICIGRGLCSLKPNAAIILDFAYYVLATYQQIFELKSTGSTFKAISGSVIRNEILMLPPLNEQHRIVAKIEELFAQLDNIASSL